MLPNAIRQTDDAPPLYLPKKSRARNYRDDSRILEEAESHMVVGDEQQQVEAKFDDARAEGSVMDSSQTPATASVHGLRRGQPRAKLLGALQGWDPEEDVENDVPASLLMEPHENPGPLPSFQAAQAPPIPQARERDKPPKAHRFTLTAATHDGPHRERIRNLSTLSRPRSLASDLKLNGRRERALWRWANVSNLDSFTRDVYDYYEGGVPESRALDQVIVKQCTRKMSITWSLGIWLYSFFFIWKSVQYFFEIRRLIYIRDFFVHLLEIPEQDMQTVSWQDVVARIMTLRDDNPKTATNIPRNLRRFIGSQSKERLDAHDIANRLMRKENFLIAMINKDALNLSLPLPLLRDRQLFSKTMEWYLHYCILDMAFNEFGQVRQDFLRADRRSALSQKMRQRMYLAGCLNLIFAPVVLAYVVIVPTQPNPRRMKLILCSQEYQKDPKMAAARKYTPLAEWKFREFNELPHIFYERLHMSFPFASRYIEQFPKRMTEEIARSVSFMAGAIMAVLAVGTVLDSELFLGFEITKDRTVLFYIGVFGGIWALARGMVSEETTVFNPEYALRNVIDYTHYMPDHWQGRLHSFEVKQEFAELYKMRVVIFLEEVLGIITTPLLLFFSLPKCADQIVDFFREFTVHVDGLGYVCSFAVFDFKKGVEQSAPQRAGGMDVREDYYSTKHGKMAASYYGFLDNYVINPKTGIPGHMPPGSRGQFHPPPVFPSLNSPSLAVDVHGSNMVQPDWNRTRARHGNNLLTQNLSKPAAGPVIPQLSPMASILLDPHNQPTAPPVGGTSPQQHQQHQHHHHRQPRTGSYAETQVADQDVGRRSERRRAAELNNDAYEDAGLDESTWETSPGNGPSRENSSTNPEDVENGVLGLIYKFRQTQHTRRSGLV
ncbi:hypothetical protein UVI_02003690 [Ustilaginoidea virens]|uniref:Autophagy-related protein 9 n=1 Tax=Ustilaginoidea virens TaxID=1159556 RepID=A0A1B5KSP1_USTVR|nr:hypothetical protein UVI_02003690 [Ustilaginoidea virens]